MRRFVSLVMSVLAAGCAAGCDDDDGRPDEWPGLRLPACDSVTRTYRIDQIHLPVDPDEAEDLGWDHDFDGTSDNYGGAIISALDSALDVDLQGAVDDILAADTVHVAITVDQCTDAAHARVSVRRGVALDRQADPPLLRAEEATSYAMIAPDGLPGAATDGSAQFPLGAIIHPSETVWIDAPRFVAVIDELDDSQLRGSLTAAFEVEAAFDTVTRAFHAVLLDRIAALGPCTPERCDEVLETLFGIFDKNPVDGSVSYAEVRDNSLVTTLLRPDVDADGPTWSSPDGTGDALSVGVGFHATRVEPTRR